MVKHDEQVTFFLFLKSTDYSAHAGTKGDRTGDSNDMGIFAVSYTTYYIRPCFEPSVTTADNVLQEKESEKKKRDKKLKSSLFTMKMPVFTVGGKLLMILSLY